MSNQARKDIGCFCRYVALAKLTHTPVAKASHTAKPSTAGVGVGHMGAGELVPSNNTVYKNTVSHSNIAWVPNSSQEVSQVPKIQR